VIADAELKRAAGTVTKALARWLAGKGYVSEEEAAEGAAQAAGTARDLPRAEALAHQLMEYTERHGTTGDEDEDAVEDHLTIKRVCGELLILGKSVIRHTQAVDTGASGFRAGNGTSHTP
jgi:hypothetical protein